MTARQRWSALAAASILIGCGQSASTQTSAAALDRQSARSGDLTTSSAVPVTATSTMASSVVAPQTSASAPPAGEPWPFRRWTRAEAITFNWSSGSPPDFKLLAYSAEDGWSSTITTRKALTDEQAKQALGLVLAGDGDNYISKCALPRHAVVFYDGDQPVASLNVCFTCGDILLSPQWSALNAEMKAHKHGSEERDKLATQKHQMYKSAFAGWKTFFQSELKLPIGDFQP